VRIWYERVCIRSRTYEQDREKGGEGSAQTSVDIGLDTEKTRILFDGLYLGRKMAKETKTTAEGFLYREGKKRNILIGYEKDRGNDS